MALRGAVVALTPMNNDKDPIPLVTERYERRLAEECGKLRVEMAVEFGKLRTEMAQGFGALRAEMAQGLGELRAEMIQRNGDLLKWLLVFFTMQTAALAALLNFLVK